MLCHAKSANRSRSLHLERLRQTVPVTFRGMRWIGRGERSQTDTIRVNVRSNVVQVQQRRAYGSAGR
jgi:hypothetical protein